MTPKMKNMALADKDGNVLGTFEVVDSVAREAAENFPIKKIVSDSADTGPFLRSLDSGSYVLRGKFRAHEGATGVLSFSSALLVNVIKSSSKSSVQIFYPTNNCVQFLEITDTAMERTNVYLNQMQESIGTMKDLATEEKTSLVGAVNELAAKTVSWDDLTDKPFGGQGVTIVSEPEIARSDAEYVRIAYNNQTMTGGYDVIGLYVKISDRVFTKEELGAAILTHADSQEEALSADEILGDDKAAYVLTEDAGRILLISSSKLSLALEEFYDEFVEGQGPVELPSRGTYVLATEQATPENHLFYPEIIGITVPTAYQTLDEKYIPNTIATAKELDVVQRKARDYAVQAKMEAENDVATALQSYVRTEYLESILGEYIEDVDALLGGDL